MKKIVSFLNKIASSPKRSRNKTAVLKEISVTLQQNRDVVNLHRLDQKNAGDFYCAPHHYFEELQNKELDIFDYKSPEKTITNRWIQKISNNALIIGGGGLLNRGSFEKQMKLFESLGRKNKKIVLWGIGHNSKNPKLFGKISSYNINTANFGLVGTRDYSLSENWVPCVSCLHPVFDQKFSSDQEIGIIFHKKTLKKKSVTSKFQNYPSTSNTTDLESLVTFIGRSETVITDSYHAMYWSMLLGKKVVVVPNSSKFFDFKYHPVISTFESCLKDAEKAVSFSGILEECREVNRQFAARAFDYLGN